MSEKKGFFGRLFNRGKQDEAEDNETLSEAVSETLEPALTEEPVAEDLISEAPPVAAEDTSPDALAKAETPQEDKHRELRGVIDAVYSRPAQELAPEKRAEAERLTAELQGELLVYHEAIRSRSEQTESGAEKKSGGFLSNLFGGRHQEQDETPTRDVSDQKPEHIEHDGTDTILDEDPVTASEDLELEIEETEPEPDLPVLPEADENQEPVPETPVVAVPEKKSGFFSRLTQGLSKSSAKLSGGVSAIFTRRKLDDDTLEELEDLLITADLGVAAATRITTALARDKFDKEISDEEVRQVLAEQVAVSLSPLEKEISIHPDHRPHVILMTGVNGAGKTTTIGKLAKKFSDEGKSVMLAAGDTFRAAAIEQLTVWGERVGAPVISREVGADAAGLAYDALQEAREKNIDVLMIDTAGRLQNRTELMDELAKIVRVIQKLDETAPHDTILVLDATVGQNAISQAEAFTQIAGVSGLIMTKLDGTARGGVLVALADKFALPVHYVGVGESVEDLQPFNAENFTRALTGIESLTEAA